MFSGLVKREVASKAGDGDGREGVEEVEVGAVAAGNAVEVVVEVIAVQVAGSVAVVLAFAFAFAFAGLLARRAEEGASACVDILETYLMMSVLKKRSMES